MFYSGTITTTQPQSHSQPHTASEPELAVTLRSYPTRYHGNHSFTLSNTPETRSTAAAAAISDAGRYVCQQMEMLAAHDCSNVYRLQLTVMLTVVETV